MPQTKKITEEEINRARSRLSKEELRIIRKDNKDIRQRNQAIHRLIMRGYKVLVLQNITGLSRKMICNIIEEGRRKRIYGADGDRNIEHLIERARAVFNECLSVLRELQKRQTRGGK